MVRTLALTVVLFALTAPVAMAVEGHDGGEGWVGETNDALVTNAGFLLIAFFPAFILVMSLIQWQLEKRKDAAKEAAKSRAARAHERQGY